VCAEFRELILNDLCSAKSAAELTNCACAVDAFVAKPDRSAFDLLSAAIGDIPKPIRVRSSKSSWGSTHGRCSVAHMSCPICLHE
jgi:hypothetical protein